MVVILSGPGALLFEKFLIVLNIVCGVNLKWLCERGVVLFARVLFVGGELGTSSCEEKVQDVVLCMPKHAARASALSWSEYCVVLEFGSYSEGIQRFLRPVIL